LNGGGLAQQAVDRTAIANLPQAIALILGQVAPEGEVSHHHRLVLHGL
jgi:hypothetical protein